MAISVTHRIVIMYFELAKMEHKINKEYIVRIRDAHALNAITSKLFFRYYDEETFENAFSFFFSYLPFFLSYILFTTSVGHRIIHTRVYNLSYT